MNPLQWFLAAVGILASLPFLGQQPCDIVLSGAVVDQSSTQGLSYATVREIHRGAGVSTDSLGLFRLEGMCRGMVELQVTHVGCEPVHMRFNLRTDTAIVFLMDHSESLLKGYEVVAELAKPQQITRMELRGEDMDRRSGMLLGELTEALPGMRILRTGNAVAKPVFRGLHSNRLLLMNNGIRQEGQYWGAEHSPEIDPFVARSVAIIEGVDALRYASDALGGVLLIEPANVFDARPLGGRIQSALQTNGRGGALSAEVEGQLPFMENFSFRVQASAKRLGDMRDSRNFLTNTGISEQNVSYALGYKVGKWKADVYYANFNQKFGLYRYSHLGNLTDLQQVLEGRPQPDTLGFSYRIRRPFQEVSHELVKARLQYTLNDQNSFEWIYARQFNRRREYDIHVGRNPSQEALSRPQLDYALTTHMGEALWHHSRGRWKSTLGSSVLQRRNRYRGREFMPNYRDINWSAFALSSLTREEWKFSAGLRYNSYRAEVFQAATPADRPIGVSFEGVAASVAAARKVAQGDWRLSLSSHWRGPAINELFSNGLHHGAGGIEVGNPDLDSERSYNLSLGLRQTWGKVKIHAVGYVHLIQNFIFMNPTGVELTIRGAFPRFDFEQDDALFRGADLQVDWAMAEHWTAAGSASLVWASNMDQGTFFMGIPAHRLDLSFTHSFQDMAAVKGLYASVAGQYTMRQFRAPEIYPFDEVREMGSAAELPLSFDFAAPPDGFFLLQLEAGMRIGKSGFTLTVDNALNAAYRDYMNRFRYFADEPGINVTLRYQYLF